MLNSPAATRFGYEFAERISSACDAKAECPDKHHGRQSWLRSQLKLRGIVVSAESVSRWCSGEGRPRQDKCEKLAEILGVDALWLFVGDSQSPALGKTKVLTNEDPVTLKIAIRSQHVVEIVGLPLDLSASEARKIANIVLAHATADH